MSVTNVCEPLGRSSKRKSTIPSPLVNGNLADLVIIKLKVPCGEHKAQYLVEALQPVEPLLYFRSLRNLVWLEAFLLLLGKLKILKKSRLFLVKKSSLYLFVRIPANEWNGSRWVIQARGFLASF